MKHIFIVMVVGYWGKGESIKLAALKCKKSGANSSDKALIKMVTGDETAYVDDYGAINHKMGAEVIHIAKFIPLSVLTKLID